MISNVSLNAYSYNSHFSGGGASDKLFVPVSPSQVIYTQFDHISGVAAPQGETGVPVNKLKILNTLIDQLVSMKRNAAPVKQPVKESEVDGLIKDYQNEIARITKSASANPFILPGRTPQAAAVFSITA